MIHLIFTAFILGIGFSPQQELQPRLPLDTGPVEIPIYDGNPIEAPVGGLQLDIKLMDSVRGRVTADGIRSLTGADLTMLWDLAAAERLRFQPLVRLSEDSMAALISRAEIRSGNAQPDLLGMFKVTLPEPCGSSNANESSSSTHSELVRLGRILQALPEVEYAHIKFLGCPPPGDIAPPSADHTFQQGYLSADPGLNAEGAWNQGIFGVGVRLSDCEYGWDYDHEEYNDLNLHPEPGQTIDPNVYVNGWHDHGTSVLGETVATDNGYGVTGLSPEVETYTYPEWTVEDGGRREDAIANAIADSAPGDVVLLEMQTINLGNGYGPAELNPSVFNVVQVGTASGVVVVGAAGNGSQDLDSATYSIYQSWGDSGAILVGAGTPDVNHDHLYFSTYGSRVDVQGWGDSVFSTGYGNFIQYGGDQHQSYTDTFGGTSSASAMVAGAACLVQSRSVDLNGIGLAPSMVRQLLIDTGIQQGSGPHIGPLPDAGAAVAAVGPFTDFPWVDLGQGLAGTLGEPVLTPSGPLAGGSYYQIGIDNAKAISNCWLIVGLSNLSLPFKGGIMVPSTDIIMGPFYTSFGGSLYLTGVFPPGIQPGAKIYFQWWVKDPTGPVGFTASNAFEGTTQ